MMAAYQQKPAFPFNSASFSASFLPPFALKLSLFQPSHPSIPGGTLALPMVAGSQAWCW
jgi:hypothetical protein